MGDVRFFTGSGNTAVSRMRNAFGHNYWNSSLWTWLWGRYHVPQNAFIVFNKFICHREKMRLSHTTTAQLRVGGLNLRC